MIPEIMIGLMLFILVITALAVAFTKKNLTAIIIYTTFSLIMSILWIVIKAPDLAITEAAVGAGITSILMYVVLRNIKEIDFFEGNPKKENVKTVKNKGNILYKVTSILLSVGIIAILLITVSHLPTQGSADVPAVNEVFTRYVQDSVEETGALNTVASVILDYRAFDTFGEASMLFTATIAVVALIRSKKDEDLTYEEINRRR